MTHPYSHRWKGPVVLFSSPIEFHCFRLLNKSQTSRWSRVHNPFFRASFSWIIFSTHIDTWTSNRLTGPVEGEVMWLLGANTCELCSPLLAETDYFQLRCKRKWAILIPDSTFMLINLLNKPRQESLYFFFWLRRANKIFSIVYRMLHFTAPCLTASSNFLAFRFPDKSFFSYSLCDWMIFHHKWETSPGKWLSLKSNRNRAQFHFQDKKNALPLLYPASHK